jgi:hypothetical protein
MTRQWREAKPEPPKVVSNDCPLLCPHCGKRLGEPPKPQPPSTPCYRVIIDGQEAWMGDHEPKVILQLGSIRTPNPEPPRATVTAAPAGAGTPCSCNRACSGLRSVPCRAGRGA